MSFVCLVVWLSIRKVAKSSKGILLLFIHIRVYFIYVFIDMYLHVCVCVGIKINNTLCSQNFFCNIVNSWWETRIFKNKCERHEPNNNTYTSHRRFFFWQTVIVIWYRYKRLSIDTHKFKYLYANSVCTIDWVVIFFREIKKDSLAKVG